MGLWYKQNVNILLVKQIVKAAFDLLILELMFLFFKNTVKN